MLDVAGPNAGPTGTGLLGGGGGEAGEEVRMQGMNKLSVCDDFCADIATRTSFSLLKGHGRLQLMNYTPCDMALTTNRPANRQHTSKYITKYTIPGIVREIS